MNEGGCGIGPEVVNDAKRLWTSDPYVLLGSIWAKSQELWPGKLGEPLLIGKTLARDHYHE